MRVNWSLLRSKWFCEFGVCSQGFGFSCPWKELSIVSFSIKLDHCSFFFSASFRWRSFCLSPQCQLHCPVAVEGSLVWPGVVILWSARRGFMMSELSHAACPASVHIWQHPQAQSGVGRQGGVSRMGRMALTALSWVALWSGSHHHTIKNEMRKGNS